MTIYGCFRSGITLDKTQRGRRSLRRNGFLQSWPRWLLFKCFDPNFLRILVTSGRGKASEERWRLVGRRLTDLGRPLPLPLPHLLGGHYPGPPKAVAKLSEDSRGRQRDPTIERLDCHKTQDCHVSKQKPCMQLQKNISFVWDSISYLGEYWDDQFSPKKSPKWVKISRSKQPPTYYRNSFALQNGFIQ